MGIVKLSLIPNGSCSSTSVAASAPAKAGYSRSSTYSRKPTSVTGATARRGPCPAAHRQEDAAAGGKADGKHRE